jgi:hypothetical protein
MTNKFRSPSISVKEVVFQIVLHILVFIFYSFDKHEPRIAEHQVVFFLSYAVAVFFINYFLLSRFFYRKKYIHFFGFVLLILAAVIVMEEKILEPLYFPGTKRAANFPGVFFTLLDILPVITVLSGFKFAWDALGKQREVDQLKIAVKESELQFLKSQINPHFLFNNLNNLYSYAIAKSDKTPEIILELSGVLRYMLYECKEKYVPLDKEVSQLKNFINLNEMQIEDRGRVSFNSENIRPGYRIAPLILIVFIENAFKYSTSTQADNISISVDLKLTEHGILKFQCTNTFQPQSVSEDISQGIGLENVMKRLELLYPNAHQLQIQKRDNIFEVSLEMDLHNTHPI